MSMSAEEILINCEKQFSFLKKDIDILISYIMDLLAQCKQIDNSNFYENQINLLLEKLKNENDDLIQNTYEKEISKEAHVAIETYHEIQRFAERKREIIADLKTQAFLLKQDVLQQEQEQIKISLQKSNIQNILELKNQLLINYKKDEDKLFVKKLIEENEQILINKNKEQILEFIFEKLETYKTSKKVLIEEVISNSFNLYKDDKDVFDLIQNEIQILSKSSSNNSNNFFKTIKEYFFNSSKLAEQETIRKDNVNKIVNAIREVGYVVDTNNIRKITEKNLVIIHGEKPSGETADFAVRHDGSFVYNWEGFEGHEHDEDAKAFLSKLKEFNLHSSQEFNKQYREPKYIAKLKKIAKEKKNNSNK